MPFCTLVQFEKYSGLKKDGCGKRDGDGDAKEVEAKVVGDMEDDDDDDDADDADEESGGDEADEGGAQVGSGMGAEDEWTCFNDGETSTAKPKQICAPTAYLLFYMRRHGPSTLP